RVNQSDDLEAVAHRMSSAVRTPRRSGLSRTKTYLGMASARWRPHKRRYTAGSFFTSLRNSFNEVCCKTPTRDRTRAPFCAGQGLEVQTRRYPDSQAASSTC